MVEVYIWEEETEKIENKKSIRRKKIKIVRRKRHREEGYYQLMKNKGKEHRTG